MNHPICIRAASSPDKSQIERFLCEMDLLADDILAPNTKYWVAELENQTLAGCAGLEFGLESGLLRSVAVSTECRNMGLGRDLVHTALTCAIEMGYKNIYLFSVRSGNYWQKLGFQKTSVEELVLALPQAPQVLRFDSIGKLANETGWKKIL